MYGCVPRFRAACFLVACVAVCRSLAAAEIPSTWIDDAQLHDVKLVGSKFAIAVGDHGAIWKSGDGGQSWTLSRCGLDVALRSVCFLDNRTGWIAGGDLVGYSGMDRGVLLTTRDGGETWQQIKHELLPPLRHVKFFGLDDGLVVGQPTALSPAGIYKTSDGGKSWQGVQGETSHDWKAMCFLEPEMGVVAGINGRVSLMGGDQLYPSKLQPQGFRSIRAIGLLSNDSGWLAGDGGLILSTATGGVVWEPPANPLPEELREGIDFHAVDVRDKKIWLAGSPGSVIWHSPDGGLRWVKQITGQAAPLNAIRFSSDQLGLAVGSFGVIVRTEDGGTTWKAVRGAGRRAAVLALHARSGRTSPHLITKLSGEMGYRSAVWIAQRDDVGPLSLSSESEAVLQAAVQKSGGHAVDVHWQLPQTRPGVEYSSDQLTKEWQTQTEGRLPQTLLGGIVRQIRTWRPSVIVVDQPSSDDAAGQLLFDATLRAVAQAADATRYPEQTQFTALPPWNVERVYMRLAAGGTGDAHVDLDEFLVALKASNRSASGPALALLSSGRVPQSETVESPRIAYRWIGLDGKPAGEVISSGSGTAKGRVSRDFFSGLAIAPGSDARRDLLPIDESRLESTQRLIEKQRNFTGLFQKSLDDPQKGSQMIGQIRGIVEGMEPQQAVGMLRELADEYRKRSQFELVEATYVELIRRYPEEPGSVDAMRWLIQFWSSSETAWQRSRLMKTQTSVSQKPSSRQIQQALGQSSGSDDEIQQTSGLKDQPGPNMTSSAGSPTRIDLKLDFEEKADGKSKPGPSTRMKVSREVDWRTGAIGEWHGRAQEMAKQLQKSEPKLFQSPEIQFPLAALRRLDGSARAADTIVRNFVTNAANSATRQLAERELWASFSTLESPQALAFCYRSENRPHLDGLLSDPCWSDAKEIHLRSDGDSPDRTSGTGDVSASLAMFAYDAEFFYIALKVPRAKGAPLDLPKTSGRQHDADLSRHDRVTIRLDIDRDYATWYEFQVDQRGWTAESCWEDRRWNPTWYVAAEADEGDWRIEAAIPWSELTPTPPRTGTIYAISLLRTTPTVGLQSWTPPATVRPQPASFGLLKFE